MQHLITQYGYVAVFLLMLAESACIPIPSEVIMLFGGALAAGAYPGAHPTLIGIANDFHGPTYAIAGIVVVALMVALVLLFRRRRAATARTASAARCRAGLCGRSLACRSRPA